MKSYYVFFLSLFLSISSFSQNNNFEESKVFVESKTETVVIDLEGSKFNINQKVFERKRYNKAVNANYYPDRVYTGHFSVVSDIKAKVGEENKKGKYKTKAVQNITKKDAFSGVAFYDDRSYYEVSFPAMPENSFSELSYNVNVPDEHFLSRFYFTEYLPVKHAKYELQTHEEVEIGWKVYGLQKDQVQFKKENIGGKVKYSWELKDGEALVSKKNELGYLHKVTHLVVYIKSYIDKDKLIPVLSSPSDLFQWYQTLIDKIPNTSNEELHRITNELITGSINDLEKAKRIFEWVQDNIRYVAIEDGWRGFIPYPAGEICEKRYGDCKDMSNIMYEMMKFAGIRAEHTWVGTRKIPYKYEDTPCPSVDNHLILSVFIDGQHYILDATDANTPFGIPSTFILGKEVLYKDSLGEAAIYQVPTYSANDCVNENIVEVSADETTLLGSVKKYIETFEYATFLRKYGASNTEKEEYLDEYLELGDNNINYRNRTLGDDDPRKTHQFVFDFSLPSYIKKFGDSYYLNLNMTKPTSDYVISEDRKVPLKIPYKSKYISTISFTIPKGKELINIPDAVNVKSQFGNFEASYSVNGNKITYNRVISIETIEIHPIQFQEWNAFLKKLDSVYGLTIEYK